MQTLLAIHLHFSSAQRGRAGCFELCRLLPSRGSACLQPGGTVGSQPLLHKGRLFRRGGGDTPSPFPPGNKLLAAEQKGNKQQTRLYIAWPGANLVKLPVFCGVFGCSCSDPREGRGSFSKPALQQGSRHWRAASTQRCLSP